MIVTNEVKRITSSKYNLSNEVHKEVITRAKISGSWVEIQRYVIKNIAIPGIGLKHKATWTIGSPSWMGCFSRGTVRVKYLVLKVEHEHNGLS